MCGSNYRRRLMVVVVAAGIVAAGCSISTVTTTSQPPTTIAPPLGRVMLTPSGLGIVGWGDASEAVTEELTARFGAPDRDSGFIDPDSIYGECPGTRLQAIGWGTFVALFTDTAAASGELGFYAWTYGFDLETTVGGVDPRELGLTTAEGVGVGSTRESLRKAYGDRLSETEDLELEVWGFAVMFGPGSGYRGLLSGPEPDAIVLFIESLPGCD
jgi:hypothetical protein